MNDDDAFSDLVPVAIIPADGWSAVYCTTVSGPLYVEPLVCWALQRGGDIAAQVADVDGSVWPAEDDSAFVSVRHKHDPEPLDGPVWRQRADQAVKREEAHQERLAQRRAASSKR